MYREGSKVVLEEVKKGFNGLNFKGFRTISGGMNIVEKKGIICVLYDIVDIIGVFGLFVNYFLYFFV